MILVLDNYDSFTWNLVQLIRSLGAEVRVCRNDDVTVAEVEALAPARIVISPGPGTPADAGVSTDVVRRLGSRVPILGVCLGHQAIGIAYGGRVVAARRPMHGKTSPIAHRGTDLFRDIPSPAAMTRYHSLVLDPGALPAGLEVTAWTDEAEWADEIQAVRHREHPVRGVQFHPESVASPHGERLLRNFLELEA